MPKELDYPYRSNNDDLYNQWAKSFYEWLMNNREKIEFNYDGEKKWF